jgi:hypothetical protein
MNENFIKTKLAIFSELSNVENYYFYEIKEKDDMKEIFDTIFYNLIKKLPLNRWHLIPLHFKLLYNVDSESIKRENFKEIIYKSLLQEKFSI